MNPIVVEHVIVTPLEDTLALQTLTSLLHAAGCRQDGPQQFDPARPQWTLIRYKRGLANTKDVRNVGQFPQDYQIEWERGRFKLALSMDPVRAKAPIRKQCQEALLKIAELLEQGLSGARPKEQVINEWGQMEIAAPIKSGAAGTPFFNVPPVPIKAWTIICLVFCAVMVIGSLGAYDVTWWGKLILLALGLGGCALLVLLLMGKWTLAPERSRLISAGVAGVAWTLLMAAIYLMPLWKPPEPTAVGKANAPKPAGVSKANARDPLMPSISVTDLSRAKSALESNDPANIDAATLYLSSQETIAPDIREVLRRMLTTENAGRRETIVSLFCKSAPPSDEATIEGICRQTKGHFASCWQPAFAALLVMDPARANKVFEDRAADRQFVPKAEQAIEATARTHEDAAISLLSSNNNVVVDQTMQALGRAGTSKSIAPIQAAQKRPGFHGSLDKPAGNAVKAIMSRN